MKLVTQALFALVLLPVLSAGQEECAPNLYGLAIERAAELAERDWMIQVRLRTQPSEVSPTEDAVYEERWSDVVEAMLQGARQEGHASKLHPEVLGQHLRGSCYGTRGALNAMTIEMRRALEEGCSERALEICEASMDFAATVVEQSRFEEMAWSLAHAFIALPEAWRDEDVARLEGDSAARFEQLLLSFEDRLPREISSSREELTGLIDSERSLAALNDSLRALRIQVRFLRLANSLHRREPLPELPDEPVGALQVEAGPDASFTLRSSYSGLGRRRSYSRVVTLR